MIEAKKNLKKLYRRMSAIAQRLRHNRSKVLYAIPAHKECAVVRREKFLFVTYFDPNGIPTIIENIENWARLSRFNVDILNLFGGHHPNGLEIPRNIDLAAYQGVLVHCTVAYNPLNLRSLDRQLKTKFSDFRGLKILMKQDEHFRTNETAEYISDAGIDCVITITLPGTVGHFYPPQKVGRGVRFIHAHTGYVSDSMLKLSYPSLENRPILLGYRGSIQNFSFGMLAFEKRDIGERFLEICRARKMTADISSRWEDRFSGQAWFDFLGGIRGVLGVESGASIVDFDGAVDNQCQKFLASNPNADFQTIYDKILKRYEDNAYYKAISPRHLEAVATKTVQIMYDGDFSGVFVADRHYLALRRDFSNLDEVLEKFGDTDCCTEMVDRAYEEIVLNPIYQYPHFVNSVDDFAEEFFDSAGN